MAVKVTRQSFPSLDLNPVPSKKTHYHSFQTLRTGFNSGVTTVHEI